MRRRMTVFSFILAVLSNPMLRAIGNQRGIAAAQLLLAGKKTDPSESE